ncbi:MAG: hypothetical protein H6595_03985 [Flavobacteriales bacterium]|nr:hypothetical protein [Flavobacteriales bacterium]MCB9166619.1 hypothetical protein [Flavobacteriales bacterium]
MTRPSVLFFGRNPSMMAIVDLQLKEAGITATGYMDEAELKQAIENGEATMLVIGGGVEKEPRERMKALCAEKNVLVLEHWGGPQNLPENINEAFS